MKEALKLIYRKIKFGYFTTLERENSKFHSKRQMGLIHKYLDENLVRKLQIGAQSNLIPGWLNIDLLPKSHDVVFMDAIKPFPIPSSSIDYIFTEHMIEHISFEEASFMLKECFRVLKGKGKIRISTPDLEFLANLYREDKSSTQEKYISYSTCKYLKNAVPSEDVYVINNFFRDWGHRFIHDEKSLTFLLTEAGFSNITRCAVNKSNDENFRGIEQHGKEISEEFNHLESIVMEAEKK